MGASLNMAVNKNAYLITDRATWISFKNKSDHAILVENEPLLYNFYGVIPINLRSVQMLNITSQRSL